MTFPKSIVPGVGNLADPLSAAFIIEKNFKIMQTFFSSVEDVKEMVALSHQISDKIEATRVAFLQ